MTPAGLLTLTLLLPTADPAGPQWQRGEEFTYSGTVAEAIDRPANRFRRKHDLEVRVLVLDRRDGWADIAVLTLLRRTDDGAAGAVNAVTGANPNLAPNPPATRLDLIRVHADGTVHLLNPSGSPPLNYAKDTPTRVVPAVPLDSFAPFEFGMFPPQPREAGRAWTVASPDPARPAETWQVVQPPEFINGERCARQVMVQQTADWEKPQGGQTAWQRVDAVWVSTLDATARRVHRVIRQRDGLAPAPAAWVEVKYDLSDRVKLNGRTFDRSRSEIETAYAANAELAQLLPDAARLGAQPFEARLAKLDKYLKENDAGSAYREALLAVRRRLEAACRGDVTPVVIPPSPPPPAERPARAPEVGQPAPDFIAGGFRLTQHRGSPVVLVFFKPGSETADQALTVAEALTRRYVRRTVVVPLSVYGDAAAGTKDRDRLKLTIAIHDGRGAQTAYAVETFPRFLLIDAGGVLRWEFRGVGAETGYLLCQELDKLLLPPSRTTGTIGTPSVIVPMRP